MKRSTIVTLSTIAGVAGVLGLNPDGVSQSTNVAMAATETPTTSSNGNATSANTTATTTPATTAATAAPTAQAVTATKTTSGTITGQAVGTRFGPLQLSATVSGGKITNIDAIQYPANDGRSMQISSYAIPILTQQALSAQSANIQGVGGATYTTRGYLQSLQSILDQL